MEEVVWKIRQMSAAHREKTAMLKRVWNKQDTPDKITPSMKILLDEIRENIESVHHLLLLLQLYGHSIQYEYLMTTTPLFYQPCPHFRYTIPTHFSEEEETYKYPEAVVFAPASEMIVSTNQAHLSIDDCVVFQPGDDPYTLHGGGRKITVHASRMDVTRCTSSYDLVLPLGVVAKNVTTNKKVEGIHRIGQGLVSWSPNRVEALRGSLKVTIEWISMETTFAIPLIVPPLLSLNHILLNEINKFLEIDSMCERIEAILWEGIPILDRHAIHMNPVEREVLRRHVKATCNVEALLLESHSVRTAEAENELWQAAKRSWRGSWD